MGKKLAQQPPRWQKNICNAKNKQDPNVGTSHVAAELSKAGVKTYQTRFLERPVIVAAR